MQSAIDQNDLHFQNVALMTAIEKDQIEMVRLILNAGVDVHFKIDVFLRFASSNGHTEIVRLLLDAGADVHAWNNFSLRYASVNGHTEIVRILLDAGADVHTEDDCTIQWLIEDGCQNSNIEIVRLLLKHWGNHPIKFRTFKNAIIHNQFEIVKMLLQQDLSNINFSELLQLVPDDPHMQMVLLQEPNIFLYALHHPTVKTQPYVEKILNSLDLPYLQDVILDEKIDRKSLKYKALERSLSGVEF